MRKIAVLLIIVVLVAAAAAYYFVVVSPGDVISKQEIEEFVKNVNSNVNGLTLELAPQDVDIQSDIENLFDKPQYLVTVSKARFLFDSTFFESPTPSETPYTIPVETDKIVIRYRPVDQYLSLVTINTIKVDLKEAIQSTMKDDSKKLAGSALVHVGQVALNDFNLSPLLQDNEGESQNARPDILEVNSVYNISAGDVSFKADDESGESFQVTIDTLTADQNFNSDFISALFDKTQKTLDMTSFSQSSESILSYKLNLQGLQLTRTKQTGQNSTASVASSEFSYSLEPSQHTGMFKGTLKQSLKELRANLPDEVSTQNLWLKTFTHIEEEQLELNVDKISSAMLNIYRDIVQEQVLNSSHASKEERKKQFSAYGFRLMGVLMQSQPIISFNLSPLKLSYAHLNASGSFTFGTGPFPVGKATAKIMNFEGLKDAIVKQNFMKPNEAEGFIFLMRNYFIVDSEGNGVISFEVRPEPPYMFLNGNPFG